MRYRLFKMFTAIENNDKESLKKLLIDNESSDEIIPANKLAALLVVAGEKLYFDLVKEIMHFNYNSNNKIPDDYVWAALRLISKNVANNNLKETLH
jgi:hypothetical protein